MPTFPRAIEPSRSVPPEMPGALLGFGFTGKSQSRSTMQVGRTWQETYIPFDSTSVDGRAFLAFVNNVWRNGITFDILHYSFKTHNGSGTGSPLVAGAGQTGSSLNTDAWTGTNPVLKNGDIIKISGHPVFDITADAPNLAAGATTLAINPPIFTGNSPTNNAPITYTGVLIVARIARRPASPPAGNRSLIIGYRLTFQEVW